MLIMYYKLNKMKNKYYFKIINQIYKKNNTQIQFKRMKIN